MLLSLMPFCANAAGLIDSYRELVVTWRLLVIDFPGHKICRRRRSQARNDIAHADFAERLTRNWQDNRSKPRGRGIERGLLTD